MTELATGLGMLGEADVRTALALEPREMVSVSPELWQNLRDLHDGGRFRQEFEAAWMNGRAFLSSTHALRGRRPIIIEWKGATRAPGDEVVPADLRVDHVYLVSCKYLSKIVLNASPAYLFDRLLAGGQGLRGTDWYRSVAPSELEALYRSARDHTGLPLPASLDQLAPPERRLLAKALRRRWPPELMAEATRFAALVSERTAEHWRASLLSPTSSERLLWRLLRIGSAPYFVLGTDSTTNLRLRIETPWDWRQRHRLVAFEIGTKVSEQPIVTWRAVIEDRPSGEVDELLGHVEIRWSHGKFNGPPEAKVYLDTPHHRVPGYVPLT